jgi:hypothetical protein
LSAHYDIAVIGSGAAGIAAAVTAARLGCDTLMLDKNPALGGIGGLSGLTTLCGLYDDEGKHLNDGFAQEFAGAITEAPALKMGRVWVLPYRPAKFRTAAQNFILASPRLRSVWHSPLASVVVENDRIISLNGFTVGAVIDCSGVAEVARATGAKCLQTDDSTQAPAVIFPLHNVTRVPATPADVAKIMLPLVRAGFPPLSFQPNLDTGAVTIKFTGLPEQVPSLLKYLRDSVPGFENSETPYTKFLVTRRDGRMIIGEHVLTGNEVLSGRTFDDAVARCAWPVEQWNIEGKASLRYLPPGAHYEIPARSLRAAKLKNLFMAGKTISADVDAIASARVMGCCLATGAAAGKLAAGYLDSARPA